jgi:alpha-L-fucosidase
MAEKADPVKAWFSQRRFGLFLHFGLYAIEGWHEQDQMRRRIPRRDYEPLITRFNPVDFDPERILDLAESAGMEYVCLTTKHHDGFCLWDTKQTGFNVMRSPYGRDVVRQLADACHRRKFPLGLYYSVVDWHHPNYPNQNRSHELLCPEEGDKPDWDAYKQYLIRQVTELCSNYGPVRHFFWDMNVSEQRDPAVNNLLRALQPGMVINDRGFDEGDFGTPEREYQQDEVRRCLRFSRPTEACNSVGTQSWGYRQDEDYYSTETLMSAMDSVMAKGGHYLLNVGPDARGRIPEEGRRILSDIGAWYRKVRESFGDSEPATSLAGSGEVLLTKRGRSLYVHAVPPLKSDAIIVPGISESPVRAMLLNTSQPLDTSFDVLPCNWQSGSRVLRIRRLPRHLLAGEPLVVRLEF